MRSTVAHRLAVARPARCARAVCSRARNVLISVPVSIPSGHASAHVPSAAHVWMPSYSYCSSSASRTGEPAGWRDPDFDDSEWAFAERHYIDYVRTLGQLRARFDLRRLLSFYDLDAANEALADVAAGRCTKAVLRPSG